MASEKELVVVTGCAGYLGAHVVYAALKAGYRVRGTARSPAQATFLQELEYAGKTEGDVEVVQADLLKEEDWKAVCKGVNYVIHTASPFTLEEPKHEDELIKPAVQGTLTVLKAAAEAKNVKRVVLTSSTVSIHAGLDLEAKDGKIPTFNEENWSDVKKPVGAYSKSKTLAEKAAWDLVKEHEGFQLAVINPCFILGPPLSGRGGGTSCDVIKILLEGQMPGLPNMFMTVCDVRDVAQAHVLALTAESAVGNRHIVCTKGMFYEELAGILAKKYNPQGWKVPTKVMPKPAIWFASFFNAQAKYAIKHWGLSYSYDSKRAQELGITTYTDANTTLHEMAEAMLALKMVDKPEPGFFAKLFGGGQTEKTTNTKEPSDTTTTTSTAEAPATEK